MVDEWTLEATPPGAEPWPGEARSSITWDASGAFLVERTTVEMPEAPSGVSILGCDAANGTYERLYSDDRGICRSYGMSFAEREWRLWREGQPFAQRFVGRISEDGSTIDGRWEKDTGSGWETDFALIYRRT